MKKQKRLRSSSMKLRTVETSADSTDCFLFSTSRAAAHAWAASVPAFVRVAVVDGITPCPIPGPRSMPVPPYFEAFFCNRLASDVARLSSERARFVCLDRSFSNWFNVRRQSSILLDNGFERLVSKRL